MLAEKAKGVYMIRKMSKDKYRKLFKNGVIVINGTLLCALMIPFCMLFILIDIIWLLTDGLVKKLDSF